MKAITLLQELLINTANKFPEKNALIIGKDKYTYDFLTKNSLLFAKKLKQSGLNRGDRVVVCAKNSIHSIVAFWGTLMADGIVSVVSPEITPEKINYILKDSGANAFVTDKNSDLLIEQSQDCKSISQIHLINNKLFKSGSHKINLFEVKNDENISCDFKFLNHELDLASIIYTSGSTGEPKGVMMTHRNMLTAVFSINQYLEHSDNDVILSALPMSFDYGLYQMIMTFSVGGTLILEVDALFPAHILRKIEIEKVTVLPCVPTLFSLLTEQGKKFKYDYSSLRAVTNTGATLTYKNIQQIQETFSNAKIFSMYGLTECKRCSYLPPDAIKLKPDSVGIAIPNTELWIVDENGHKVPPGVVGQLVIRGATVMKGYWNKMDATNEKLKEGPLPGEKILYTGDYGVLDEDGYLYFKGRMDDVIKFKGIKVSPIEIEAILIGLLDVKEAAVFAILDNHNDVELCICVSSYKDGPEEDLKSTILSALPKFLNSCHLFIVKRLPRNTNGKINKSILKNEIEKILCPNNMKIIA